MSVSSPEVSLSSSSTTSSSCTKDDVDYWEVNPPPTPASISRLNSLDCWDYSIELDCLKGPEGCFFFVLLLFSYFFYHLFCLFIYSFFSSRLHDGMSDSLLDLVVHLKKINGNIAFSWEHQ